MAELTIFEERRLFKLIRRADALNDVAVALSDGAGAFSPERRREIIGVLEEELAKAEREYQEYYREVLGENE